MPARRYDMVVVGGGIHGAGVAQAAAAGGYSVLALEQNQLAAGTSSRSSKLIHGGLRYLEGGHLGLVRECLRERALLLRNAPDLVRLAPFYIPLYRQTSRGRWQVRAGLSLYALLGGLQRDARFAQLPRRQWEDLDGLDDRHLKAVYRYYDAQTDDAALCRAVMASAVQLGAEVQVGAEVTCIQLNPVSCDVHFQYGGLSHSCHAPVVVNAAGPWANQVLSRTVPAAPQRQVQLVQGSHIVVDGSVGGGIYYLEAPEDQRPVFVMPWKGRVMAGTTELAFEGDPSQVAPTVAEKTYLLECLSHYFTQYRTAEATPIREAFAGLRVLPLAGGRFNVRPRDTVIHPDRNAKPRLLTIYGGKLTAYRATAERVITAALGSLPDREKRADTASLRLTPAGG